MEKSLYLCGPEELFNQRKKYYREKDGSLTLWETLTFPTQTFNPAKLEKYEKKNKCSVQVDENQKDDINGIKNPLNADKSRKRARKRLFDAIMADKDLDMMVTLTFSPEAVDRTNYGDIMHKLNVWLNNRVRRNGLKYLLVPEYHKDGEAIHMHGFVNRKALHLVDSGHKHDGRKVYNITDYPFGFTTAIRLDKHRERAAWYCYKYITKDAAMIGGRYVLQGGDIAKPVYTYDNVDYVTAEGTEYTVADGVSCKIETRA